MFRIILFVTCFIYGIIAESSSKFSATLNRAALERTRHDVRYDPAYVRLKYPGGDVAADTGVCTDVVIRSYRELGVDLQKLVHEDIRRNFSKYPARRIWGQKKPDTNIDHRRVPNLGVFFTRHGQKLPVTQNPRDYLPGDIVTWRLTSGVPHIGIVVNKYTNDGKQPLVVHNISAGPQLEDILFSYKITGHYRYHRNILDKDKKLTK